jgi:hypothetical protein
MYKTVTLPSLEWSCIIIVFIKDLYMYTHLCNEAGTKPAEQPQFKHSSEEMSQHLKELYIQRHLHEVEDNLCTRLLMNKPHELTKSKSNL